MRPQITLFEHISAHAAERRDSPSGHVIRAAVSKHQYVGNLVLAQEVVEKDRPIAEASPKIGRRLRPVDAIAGADVDPLDLRSALSHGGGELIEQGSGRALEEEEGPSFWLGLGRTRLARFHNTRWKIGNKHTEIPGRTIHWTRLRKRRMNFPCSRRMVTITPASRSSPELRRETTTSAGQGKPVTGSR